MRAVRQISMVTFILLAISAVGINCHGRTMHRYVRRTAHQRIVRKQQPRQIMVRRDERQEPRAEKMPAFSQRAPSSLGGPGQDFQVRGQSRNLSMMLVLKDGKDDINFIKPRKNYSSQILSTQF